MIQQKHTQRIPVTIKPTDWPVLSQRHILALGLAVLVILAFVLIPADLSVAARVSLGTFVLTVIGWTLTKLNDTFVALLGAAGLVISSTISSDHLFASLGNSVVWLMLGAFIVAAALNKSGISARLTLLTIRYARNVGQVFYLLTIALLLTALFIPSTSARAALMIPIYLAMATAFRDPQINRALAIMLPVNILQTAIASLVGAGAHLVINDVLGQFTGRSLTFFEWVLMGFPFAALSSLGTTWVILRLFLDPKRRALPLRAESLTELPQPGPFSLQEKYIASITLLLIVLWATETLHGIDNALVAILGALAVTVPSLGVLTFKEAAKSVEWEMIIFVAATLALSEALVASGAGKWLVDTLLVDSGFVQLESQVAILAGIAIVTLTSHLYITSRSARGAVIAPLTVLLAYNVGLDALTLAFVTAAGIGYCITLVVSAKPLTMFQQISGEGSQTFQSGDLLRLSAWLAPLHLGLILVFGLWYWPMFAKTLAIEPLHHEQAPIQTGRSGLLEDNLFPEQGLLGQLWYPQAQPVVPTTAAPSIATPAAAVNPTTLPSGSTYQQQLVTVLDVDRWQPHDRAADNRPQDYTRFVPAFRGGGERIRQQHPAVTPP